MWFLLALMVLVPVNLYLTLAPPTWLPWLWGVVQIKPHPSYLFSVALVELAVANFLIGHLLEVSQSLIMTVQCLSLSHVGVCVAQ